MSFLTKAIGYQDIAEKITIDKSGANTAAIDGHNDKGNTAIGLRQIKYLNNLVEQDHRAVKRIIRPMLGSIRTRFRFTLCACARRYETTWSGKRSLSSTARKF